MKVQAQYVAIPEAQFASILNIRTPCMSGNMLDTTCATTINDFGDLNYKNIYDLTGIQYFKNLTRLDCIGNHISFLPPLPPNLWYLDCGGNQLTSLPPIPQGLYALLCDANQLTSLPSLPTGLFELSCSVNQLTNLPALPDSLRHLICDRNNLTSLPTFPSRFSVLRCYNNQLTSLPELPIYMLYLDCSNNPNLSCLPKLNGIKQLVFRNTAITCLPNYGTVNYSAPLLSSLPLCGVSGNPNCDIFWNISGKVYFDNNFNCVYDSLDKKQLYVKINLIKDGIIEQQTMTNREGLYYFDISISNYDTLEVRLDSIYPPTITICPDTASYQLISSISDSLFNNIDFGIDSNIFSSSSWKNGLKTTTINIFPNPASEEINIEVQNSDRNFSAELFDITGKKVKQLLENKSSGNYNVNLHSFSPGIYYCRITDDLGNVIIKKIIIN